MEPLPRPDWDRPGETWRIEHEPHWLMPPDVADYLCVADRRRCARPAVALRAGHRVPLPFCAEHLRQGRMWIEGEQVVSWRLSR